MLRSERDRRSDFKRSLSHSHEDTGISRSIFRGLRSSHRESGNFADVMSLSGPASQLARSQPGKLRPAALSEGPFRSIRSGIGLPSMGMTTDANGTHTVHWEGYVRKKGDWLPRWEIRYLVLDGTVLRYYCKQEDARMGKNLRGKLTITCVTPEFHKKKEHGFVIETVRRKKFHLICETELEKDMWVEMMQAAIQESAPTGARTPRSPRRVESTVGESAILQYIPSSKNSTSHVSNIYTPREAPIDIRDFYNALRKLLISHTSSAQFFPKLCRDVSLTSNYTPTVPFWGEYHGLDGVLHFFSILYESVEYTSFFATDISQATEGGTAVIVGRETMVNKVNNRKFTQQWQHTIEFASNGRVKSLHITADPIATSAVFGCNAMSGLRLPASDSRHHEIAIPSGLIQVHVIRGEQLGTDEDEVQMTPTRRHSNLEQNTSFVVALSMEKTPSSLPASLSNATAITDISQSEASEPRWNSHLSIPFEGNSCAVPGQPFLVQLEAWRLTHQRILSPLVEDSIQDDDTDQSHQELIGIAKINLAPYITLAQTMPSVDTLPQWYTLLSVDNTPYSCGRVQLSLRFDMLSRTPREPMVTKDLSARKVKLMKQMSYSDHQRTNETFQVGNTVFDVPEHYQMIKAVGQGAYGCVIAASNVETGQSLAIKNVPNAFSDLIDAKRILREIRLMRHLRHPKLVNLVDLFRPPSLHDFNDVYIVTELMETDLHRVINSNQTLSDPHIQHFLYQMLVAVKYIHSANVLHRDLKPSNILVNANCDIKLCDFGLARGVTNDLDAALTDYVVTRWYRAPEVLLTSRYGKAMDMWAIGCILAELIGRRPLFPGTDFLHQLKIIMEVVGTPEDDSLDFITHNKAKRFITKQPKRRPIPLSLMYPRASPLALDLLEKMLTFDPRQRISVEDALAHPYLKDVRDSALEVTCSQGIFDYSFEDLELTKEKLQSLMFEDICHFHPEALWLKQTPSKASRTKKSTPPAALLVQAHDHHDHEDYYEVLGLGMDASDGDIKKAYRKLSLQYHPDKNKGNSDAEAKFQRISRAYEILSNPEMKDIYDFEGEEGLQRHANQGNRPSSPFDQLFGGGGGRQRSPDAAVEVQVTLEELYNGGEKSLTFRKNVICRKCRGSGAKDGKTKPCKTCGGQGIVLVNQQVGPGFTVQMQQQCPKCGGRGKTFKSKCPHCHGNKVVEEMKTITGVIERGMPSNHEIVFEREGEQHPGVLPGNVIMRLVQQPHRVFRRAGDDLHAQVQISLKDALLGFDATLSHLDGHKVAIVHDGITKPFEVRRIENEGMPHHHVPSQHGDLHIQHNIRFPTQLSDAQKELVKRILP